jgi:hypothetical protein
LPIHTRARVPFGLGPYFARWMHRVMVNAYIINSNPLSHRRFIAHTSPDRGIANRGEFCCVGEIFVDRHLW